MFFSQCPPSPPLPLYLQENFLVPNPSKTACILPGRVDIGRHYVLTGGLEGLRESFDKIVSRVQSFGVYNFDLDKYQIIKELFASKHFQSVAKDICPADKQTLDPFQFNFILQLPGQTVPLHLDAPYFFGASRFLFPQWLLVSMVFSNLFQNRFVDQVQVVGYLHKFDAAGRGGEFVAFTESADSSITVPSVSFSGTAVDGSKIVHAARQYMPESPLPIINKDKNNKIVYMGGGKWSLEADGEKIRDYDTDDIRMTIVYRARCFANDTERQRFGIEQAKAKNLESYTDMLELEDVLTTFAEDLVKRGKVASVKEALSMKRLKFATLILDTYIRYPTNLDRAIPVNYCLVTKQVPALTSIFSLLGC